MSSKAPDSGSTTEQHLTKSTVTYWYYKRFRGNEVLYKKNKIIISCLIQVKNWLISTFNLAQRWVRNCFKSSFQFATNSHSKWSRLINWRWFCPHKSAWTHTHTHHRSASHLLYTSLLSGIKLDIYRLIKTIIENVINVTHWMWEWYRSACQYFSLLNPNNFFYSFWVSYSLMLFIHIGDPDF